MIFSGVKIEIRSGLPDSPASNQFYLIEDGPNTYLYLSDTSARLILLNEYGSFVNVGNTEVAVGGLDNQLSGYSNFTFDSGLLSVDSVRVLDEAFGAGWDTDLTVPTKNALYDVLNPVVALLSGRIPLSGIQEIEPDTILGRISPGTGNIEVLEPAAARAIIGSVSNC